MNRSWNPERPLVFSHVVLTKTLGIHQAQEIQARITRRMDPWERDQHAGLVGDAEAEGTARKGRGAFSGEEEDDAVARSFHETVLSWKVRKAVRQATDRGVCVSPPGGQMHENRATGCRSPPGEAPGHGCPPPWKTPRAQPSKSMRKYPKRYPSTSRRMTSRGWNQSSLAQQVRWERRRWS